MDGWTGEAGDGLGWIEKKNMLKLRDGCGCLRGHGWERTDKCGRADTRIYFYCLSFYKLRNLLQMSYLL